MTAVYCAKVLFHQMSKPSAATHKLGWNLWPFSVLLAAQSGGLVGQMLDTHSLCPILRVVAFILLSIGAQIAWNGLSVLISAVLKP